MFRNYLKLVSLITCLIFSTGCASIVHGPKQDVAVSSNPDGAKVYFKPKSSSGEEVVSTTPATVSLKRKSAYDVTFEKNGYTPQTRQITKTMDGWFLGNIILGGLIGVIIDACTGAANKLEPSNIHIDLQRLEAYLKQNFNHNRVS